MSLIETVKSIIHDLDLPMCLWAEACLTIVYILKRFPQRILKDKTLDEAFTGEKPRVANLHVFVFPIYIHILDEKRTKLEPSSLKLYLWVAMKPRKLTKSTFHLIGR